MADLDLQGWVNGDFPLENNMEAEMIIFELHPPKVNMEPDTATPEENQLPNHHQVLC